MVQPAEWKGELEPVKPGQKVVVPLVAKPSNKCGWAVCPQAELLKDKCILVPGKVVEVRAGTDWFKVQLESEQVDLDIMTLGRGNMLDAREQKQLAELRIASSKKPEPES